MTDSINPTLSEDEEAAYWTAVVVGSGKPEKKYRRQIPSMVLSTYIR